VSPRQGCPSSDRIVARWSQPPASTPPPAPTTSGLGVTRRSQDFNNPPSPSMRHPGWPFFHAAGRNARTRLLVDTCTSSTNDLSKQELRFAGRSFSVPSSFLITWLNRMERSVGLQPTRVSSAVESSNRVAKPTHDALATALHPTQIVLVCRNIANDRMQGVGVVREN